MWTKEQALEVLEAGDLLTIIHPDFSGTLVVEKLVGDKFEAWFDNDGDEPSVKAGEFLWGEFTVTGAYVVVARDIPTDSDHWRELGEIINEGKKSKPQN